MKIEAGKSYRTRDGLKATIYRTDACGQHKIHGYIEVNNTDYLCGWFQSGSRHSGISEDDLIAPWVEVPTMDVTVLPRWATHVTLLKKPGEPVWGIWTMDTGELKGVDSGLIPIRFCPKEATQVWQRFRIDWDNKCLVPEEGGDK